MTKKKKIQLLANEIKTLKKENSSLRAYNVDELGRQMSVLTKKYYDITDKLESQNRKLDNLIWLKLKLKNKYMLYMFKEKIKKRFL